MKAIKNIPPNSDGIYSSYSSKKLISPFIKEGVFLNHKPPINYNYSIENFEYVTGYNNELITIGKGGYGKLYLAKNKIDNKEYAIKCVSKKKMKEMGVDSTIMKREIDIHIRITHPHIIKLYSYLEDRQNYYLALEYAQKGNLYQLIQRKKGLSENVAFYYFIQVASAIYFLHMNGYAHRDIKPENILIDEKGGVKLCDFGWCVNVAKGERITFCGTYEYMAPEMINDEFYDMGIDIWSLGVLLYEIIHGYSPFRAHHFVKDAKSAMTEIFINIKSNNYTIDKDISEECIDLIDKLLTTDTKKRIKIEDLFLHPWVVNKEKEYFPLYKRNKDNINVNNNYSNRRREKDIVCIKSSDFINFKNEEENFYNQYLNDNNETKTLSNNIETENNVIKFSKYFKNKSYCLVTTKGNSNNNGVYFIQNKNGNKKNISDKKSDKKEEENNRYNYNDDCNNKYTLTEKNHDKEQLKNYEKYALSPIIEKKDLNSKNNFVYNIHSNRKKFNNLPRVIRCNKESIENKENKDSKILKVNPNENQSQDSNCNINIKTNLNEKINPKNDEEKKIRNLSKNKIGKTTTIKDKKDSDEYKKYQKEDNELNLKILKIKEQKEIVINKLKKMEEKQKREESLRKLYDSHKSCTSYDFYSKNKKSLKNQFSYINKPKNEIATYILKHAKLETDTSLNNKNMIYKKKLEEKRSKSFQVLLNKNSLENKLKNSFKGNKSLKKKNYNYLKNDDYNDKNINSELYNTNQNFRRFRKKVVYLKKRNINIKTDENNMNKYCNTLDKNKKSNIAQTHLKPSSSIQNIFYNTYYNCLFDNSKNYLMNKYNIYEPKNNIIKKKKESKSISREKNILKNRNISKINNKEILNLNTKKILLNLNSERNYDKFNKNKILYDENKSKDEKNKRNFNYLNYKSLNKMRSLSSNKNTII